MARACVRVGMPVLEPTGGIGIDNIGEIIKACVAAGYRLQEDYSPRL